MEALIKVVKYFGHDMGANIFALYIRTGETPETVEQLAGKAVSIGVDEDMDKRATPEQVMQAKELLSQGIAPNDVASRTGCGISTIYKLKRALPHDKAKEILKDGKSVTAAVASTGVSMATAKRIARQIKKEIAPEIKAAVNPNSAPANSEASTGLMSEKDLQQYGMPTNLQFAKVPKDLQIVIGPVGVSLAPEVMKSAIEPLKALGVENIHITIDALKEI